MRGECVGPRRARLKLHLAIPREANCVGVGAGELAEGAHEDGFFGGDKAVDPDEGRLEEPGGSPILNCNFRRGRAGNGGDAANQRVLAEVKQNQGGSQFGAGRGGEREVAENYVSEGAHRNAS